MFDRFTSGPAATVTGALLLILGGVVVVVGQGGLVGTTIAFAGCLIILRERKRQRKRLPPD